MTNYSSITAQPSQASRSIERVSSVETTSYENVTISFEGTRGKHPSTLTLSPELMTDLLAKLLLHLPSELWPYTPQTASIHDPTFRPQPRKEQQP